MEIHDKRFVGQLGSQLNVTLRAFDNAIINPEALRLDDYEKMLDTDETVGQGYEFLVLGVLIKLGGYEHQDENIKDFVNKQFENMNGSLYAAAQEILTAIWAGFSVTEINYKLSKDGKAELDSLATYHPSQIYFNVDDRGRMLAEGIKQLLITGNYVDIPTNKCIIYTHNKTFGNLYGKSAFKRIYKNWALKDVILKMWARALDKFGTPLLSAIVPEGQIKDPDNPSEMIEQIDYVIRLLDDLQNTSAIAFTSQGENKGDIKAITNGASGVGEAFDRALSYINKMIYRGLLLPSLVGDEGNSGSYSLGIKHFDTFQAVLDSEYNSLTEILLDQLVKPIIEYNFGPQESYGSFPQRKLSDDNKKIMSDIFSQLTDQGYLDPKVQADFEHVRSSLDLPSRDLDAEDNITESVLKEYQRYLDGDESNE